MKLGRHAGLWLAVTLMLLMVLALFEDTTRIAAELQNEKAMARTWLSQTAVDGATERANRWFNAAFRATGAQRAAERDIRRSDHLIGSAPAYWWVNLQVICYRLMLRVALVGGFAAPVSAFLLLALVDGLFVRRIKAYLFGAANPIVYNFASHVIVAAPVLPLAYFASPLPVSFGVLLSGTMLLALALNVAASNFVPTR